MEGKDSKPEKGDPDFGLSIAFLFSPSIYQLTENAGQLPLTNEVQHLHMKHLCRKLYNLQDPSILRFYDIILCWVRQLSTALKIQTS